MSLVRVVLDAHEVLARASLPHAFGGAIAFGYYAEPRGTVDAHLSVFTDRTELPRIGALLATIGFHPLDGADPLPIAGAPFGRDADPERLDVFPSLDPRYAEIERRCRVVPYGPDLVEVPILGLEDVVLFKLSFGRPKDWVDLQALIDGHADLDIELISELLLDLRGPSMHPRLVRFRALHRAAHRDR